MRLDLKARDLTVQAWYSSIVLFMRGVGDLEEWVHKKAGFGTHELPIDTGTSATHLRGYSELAIKAKHLDCHWEELNKTMFEGCRWKSIPIWRDWNDGWEYQPGRGSGSEWKQKTLGFTSLFKIQPCVSCPHWQTLNWCILHQPLCNI